MKNTHSFLRMKLNKILLNNNNETEHRSCELWKEENMWSRTYPIKVIFHNIQFYQPTHPSYKILMLVNIKSTTFSC